MGNGQSRLVPVDASPAQYTQAFFVLSSAFIFSIQFLPDDIRGVLMDYGARRPQQKDAANATAAANASPAMLKLRGVLAKLTNCSQVPHSWFRHFYIVSTGWSVFWLAQFLSKGRVMAAIASWQQKTAPNGMGLGQTYVVAALMAVQGTRRLYESYFVARMGKSPMWFVHWMLGLLYYTAMGLGVWVEGSGTSAVEWHFRAQALLRRDLTYFRCYS
jgi:3-oxo-5-alpha-steroid 4-dehydrogenase 3